MSRKIVAWLLAMCLSACLGGVAVWWLSRPSPGRVVAEPAAPSETLPDGSVVLERKATDPTAKPATGLPKGARLERKVSVTVKPTGTGIKLPPNATVADCPPVTVDLSLARLPDESRRVVATSPNGEVVAGLDVPVETISAAARPWAAGLSLNPTHQTIGVWMERDLSRFRVGAEINQVQTTRGGPMGADARVRVGWIW